MLLIQFIEMYLKNNGIVPPSRQSLLQTALFFMTADMRPRSEEERVILLAKFLFADGLQEATALACARWSLKMVAAA